MAIYKNKDIETNINERGADLGNINVNFYTEDNGTASIRIKIKNQQGAPINFNNTDMLPRLDLYAKDGSIFTKEPVNIVLPEQGLIQYKVSDYVIRHEGKMDCKLFLENGTESVHVANFYFVIKDSGITGSIGKEIKVEVLEDMVRNVMTDNAMGLLDDEYKEKLDNDLKSYLVENKEVFKGATGDKLRFSDLSEIDKQELKGEPLLYSSLTESEKKDLIDNVTLPEISTRAAIAIKKMNTSPEEWLGNSIKICVWGNSLGAGNGASSESLSWPNRLKNTLNRYSRTGQVVTMINRSIGGYYASQVNDQFPEPSGADISIISFGTNEFNKVQRTELYAEALENIIKKEVEGGSTIVLTTMPQWGSKDWQVKASNGAMEDYNQIVHDLGNKYNIAVLDLYKETRNLDWSAYKTGEAAPHIHLNDLGYQMLSEKVAAFIGFQTPGTLRQLKNNDFLGVRAGVDGIKYVGDYLYLSESENYPTPSEATQNKGTAISSGNDEKTFHYAVNIDEDNLALFPNFKFTKTDGTESLTIYINNRNNPFDYSNTFINGNSFNRSVGLNTKILRFSDFTKHANQYNTQNIYANSNMPLHNIMFPVAGHYTLTVKVKNCDFFGFDCVGGNISKLIQSKNDTGWIPLSLTGVSNTDSNKPSAYRKIVDGDKTEIQLRIAVNGTTGQVFATLPSGFHPGHLTRLPAFSGTDNSGLVIGASGNLAATTGDSHDFRCTQPIVL